MGIVNKGNVMLLGERHGCWKGVQIGRNKEIKAADPPRCFQKRRVALDEELAAPPKMIQVLVRYVERTESISK